LSACWRKAMTSELRTRCAANRRRAHLGALAIPRPTVHAPYRLRPFTPRPAPTRPTDLASGRLAHCRRPAPSLSLSLYLYQPRPEMLFVIHPPLKDKSSHSTPIRRLPPFTALTPPQHITHNDPRIYTPLRLPLPSPSRAHHRLKLPFPTATSSSPSPTQSGWTALHFVAMRGNLDIIDTLLSRGADINAKDDEVAPRQSFPAPPHRTTYAPTRRRRPRSAAHACIAARSLAPTVTSLLHHKTPTRARACARSRAAAPARTALPRPVGVPTAHRI
jgi:hypothetical protein